MNTERNDAKNLKEMSYGNYTIHIYIFYNNEYLGIYFFNLIYKFEYLSGAMIALFLDS